MTRSGFSPASSIKPAMMGTAATQLITAMVNTPASKLNSMTGYDHYRPAGLPLEAQPWLGSVWRKTMV